MKAQIRVAALTAGIAVFGAVTPGSAAADVSVSTGTPAIPAGGYALGVGGDDLSQSVSVRLTASNFVISSSDTVVVGDGCVLTSLTAARCVRTGRTMAADMGAGADVLQLTGKTKAYVGLGEGNDGFTGGTGPDGVFGNGGNDLQVGREGDDGLNGGAGDDTLVGGRGDDILRGDDRDFGNVGSDVFSGGAGNDKLIAHDKVADEAIDCGPGRHDRAFVDRIDPKPRNCERVFYRKPPSRFAGVVKSAP